MMTYTMAPATTPADMIPAGGRIPGTLSQAAAPITAAPYLSAYRPQKPGPPVPGDADPG